jgi:hypothetical protein
VPSLERLLGHGTSNHDELAHGVTMPERSLPAPGSSTVASWQENASAPCRERWLRTLERVSRLPLRPTRSKWRGMICSPASALGPAH